MKKVLFLIAFVSIVSTSNAQIYVSDSLLNDVVTIKQNGGVQKIMPKNSCYADKNSAGNIAIKQLGTDKTVVAYQAPNLYYVNGQNSSVADTVMNRLNILITKIEYILKTKD